MSDIAIRVEGLSKRYRIGAKKQGYKTLREKINDLALSPFRAVRSFARSNGDSNSQFPTRKSKSNLLWALKDVSFEVKRGEVVGIIGRNGAGKSTLLKILSRITEPTEGYADIHGRVGSLLEVGTGFHPELTGRENIYLNGAVLGMKKTEIENKFDEIVSFAEVERFIDTPVKHYSSGMYLRLAFAVAAHLETEVLLVDEVLAVGDVAFQNKCLGKMSDVASHGRTVLYVSHNMQAVKQLCTNAYLLDGGTVIKSGSSAEVIGFYLEDSLSTEVQEAIDIESYISFKQITVIQDGFSAHDALDNSKPFEVHIHYDILETMSNLLLGFDVFSSGGMHLFRTYDLEACGLSHRNPGTFVSVCKLPEKLFQNDTYYLSVIVGIHRVKWLSKETIRLRLNFDGPRSSDVDLPGVIHTTGKWTVREARVVQAVERSTHTYERTPFAG